VAGKRTALGLTLAAALLAAGCGGGGSTAEHPKVARIWPAPRETVDQALDRIADDACRHPSADIHGELGTDPKAAKVCASIGRGVDLRHADVEVFGSGATATTGNSTMVLVLDTDRRWKIAFRGPKGETEKTPVSPDETAQLAVTSLSQDRCEDLTPYAFVYLPEKKWCKRARIRELVHDLENDASALPRRLGGDRGLMFYGVQTIGPHYWTLILETMRGSYVYYDGYRAQ
jgi:hypothetical protein